MEEYKVSQELLNEMAGLRERLVELESSAANYRAIFDGANDAIFIIDIESYAIVEANRKACEMFCYSEQEITNVSLEFLIAAETKSMHENVMTRFASAAKGEPQVFELMARDKAGHIFWVEVNLRRAIISGKYRLLAVTRDINDRKDVHKRLEKLNNELTRSNRQLKKLTLRDPHTGLFNRRYLGDVVERELSRAKRHSQPLSVIILSIELHSQNGILKEFARQLRGSVRLYDSVIRFKDKKFVVVSPNTGKSGVVAMAKRLVSRLNSASLGTQKDKGARLNVAVVSYPIDGKINKGIDLVNLADKVLTKASKTGVNRIYSFKDIKRK